MPRETKELLELRVIRVLRETKELLVLRERMV